MDSPTVETTDESVNTPAPAEEPVSTPETGEASQTSENNAGEVEVQLSPKAQQRMQKLANEARESKKLRADYQKLQEQYKQAEGALAIEKWLKEDPKNVAAFIQMQQGLMNPQGQAPQEDPYKDFHPAVAERFKKLDALEEWKANLEKQQTQSQQQYIQDNQGKLEEHFDSLLKSKGFIDDKGSFDENEVAVLSNATLAVLAKTLDDPRLANEKQVEQALDKVLAGVQSLEKRALKKVVRPAAPPSGSNKGSIPKGKTSLTDEERYAMMESML